MQGLDMRISYRLRKAFYLLPRKRCTVIMEILAIVPGYHESRVSWADVLRDLRDRSLRAAKLVVAGTG